MASYKSSFLERNRIVAGLADAILITEAAIRSGTLNTVAHALSQGKEVFVVPGNITSPMSAGCNALIKQGAHIVTCTADILEVLAPQLIAPSTTTALGSTPLEAQIISLLQKGIKTSENLQELTRAGASDINTSLTMLEIHGIVKPLGLDKWSLT